MDAKTLTAVEWLIEQFSKNGYIGLQDELQAKAMFKHQIEEAYNECKRDGYNYNYQDYYKETYNK